MLDELLRLGLVGEEQAKRIVELNREYVRCHQRAGGRLATAAQVDAAALSQLEETDLTMTPSAHAALEAHQRGQRGYQITCPHCGAHYEWRPDLELAQALCARCGKMYPCEFGEPASAT